MNIQTTNNNTTFQQLKAIRLRGEYRKAFEAENVEKLVNSIQSNVIFRDMFSKRDGYIVLDKQVKTFNNYAANVSHAIENSLSIYFDLKQGFFSRLLSAGRPPRLFKLIKVDDYKCSWEGKNFDGNIDDRFDYAIRHYDENQLYDYTNTLRTANR